MAATYQSYKIGTSSGSTSVVVDKPTSLAVGDLMVAHIASSDNTETGGDINVASGWTAITDDIRQSWSGSFCVHGRAIYKVADSSDVAASNFTFTANNTPTYMSAAIYRITGQAASDVVDDSNGTNTTGTTPNLAISVTPSQADNLYLILICAQNQIDPITSITGQAIATSNPTWTEDYDNANGHLLVGAHASRSEITATGNVSYTISGSDSNPVSVAIIVIINNAISVTISPDVIAKSAAVQAPTIQCGMTTTASVISIASSVPSPTVAEADWSSQQKSTTGTWTTQSKS